MRKIKRIIPAVVRIEEMHAQSPADDDRNAKPCNSQSTSATTEMGSLWYLRINYYVRFIVLTTTNIPLPRFKRTLTGMAAKMPQLKMTALVTLLSQNGKSERIKIQNMKPKYRNTNTPQNNYY